VQPANQVMLWEDFRLHDVAATAVWDRGNAGGNNGRGAGFPANYADWGGGNQAPYNTHSDGRNHLFCDGHVKWLNDAAAFNDRQALADGPYGNEY
jgi:prepilin-type processing-associated H-X9-DG protein